MNDFAEDRSDIERRAASSSASLFALHAAPGQSLELNERGTFLMNPDFQRELDELLKANRERALWFAAPDFVPQTPAATRRVLERIAARGDRATFVRARQLLRQLA